MTLDHDEPWPDTRVMLRGELAAYLRTAAATDPALPTRCRPWTVRDVTAHLAETFRRFADMLERGRRGDFDPPFAPPDLDAVNVAAVAEFDPAADAAAALATQAGRFLDATRDPGEPMPHQRGTIPVALQVVFGLVEVTVHHDDVAAAAGTSYVPPLPVVDVLVAAAERLGWLDEDDPRDWSAFVAGRGAATG